MIDLSARRPTRFMSSPCPAMPTTSVAKISGAMIDLIIRRNTLEIGLSVTANSGAHVPISTPTTIEIIIHDVSEMRRRPRKITAITIGERSASANYWRRRLDWYRPCAAPQSRMAVAIENVEREPDHEPPAESYPRKSRETAHHEHAERRADDAHDVNEGHPERPRTRRIGVAEDDHSDADEREREQRSDIGEIVRLASVANQRPERDEHTGEQGRDVRRAILPMDLARPPRQQTVARHCKENPRLPVLKD